MSTVFSQLLGNLSLPTDYYAPDFKVLVEGRELDATTHGDILDLNVVMDIEALTSFDMTVNNWDDSSFDFKYSDTTTFDIGKRVDIQMGYANDMRFMASGLIQSLSPRFPESGAPTLSVSGVDRRVKLRDRKPTQKDVKQFKNKADHEIAQEIARRNGLDAEVTKTAPPHPVVVQKNQDDLKFLMERAKRIDFDFFLRVNPKTGKDTLCFVSPTDNRDARRAKMYIFEWGKNLINYNTQLTLNKQVASVTVQGWDPTTKKKISYKATAKDLPETKGAGTNGPKAAEDRLAKREDIVVDQPVTSVEEAKNLAISQLRERAYQFLTGTGRVIGLPDMRPGDVVELHGLGVRFSGTSDKPLQYYVKKVTHTIGNSGYQTQFEVRSTADGGTKNKSGGR
jgi:Bacteriophage probable baseplate hub protein